MASLPTRTTASFDAIKPVSSLVLLDNEFNQYVGASGIFNGGTTATKLLVKSSDGSDPPLEIDQIGAGPLAEWKLNGTLKVAIENDGDFVITKSTPLIQLNNAGTIANITNTSGFLVLTRPAQSDLAIDLSTGVVTLGQQPVFPNMRTRWAATFPIMDVAARGVDVNADNVQRALIPAATYVATHIFLVATSGTNSGTFSINVVKAPFSGAAGTTLGTIAWDGASDTLGVGKEVDIGDHTFTANDFVQANITAVSSPQQKSVYVGVRGYQTFSAT